MKRVTIWSSALLLVAGCAASLPRGTDSETPATPMARRPTIRLETDAEDERQTRAQLERLFDRYDLSPWMLAPVIEIDRGCIPHSHPVLTLHTRHLRDELLLLSTLLHEESHWRLDMLRAGVAEAMPDLRAAFPGLPVGFPDGADSLASSYEHLIVIAWEEQGLQRLVGELSARAVMEFWATDHYRAIYRTVLDHRRELWTIMREHGLDDGGRLGDRDDDALSGLQHEAGRSASRDGSEHSVVPVRTVKGRSTLSTTGRRSPRLAGFGRCRGVACNV